MRQTIIYLLRMADMERRRLLIKRSPVKNRLTFGAPVLPVWLVYYRGTLRKYLVQITLCQSVLTFRSNIFYIFLFKFVKRSILTTF
jgi:hypothetical protein